MNLRMMLVAAALSAVGVAGWEAIGVAERTLGPAPQSDATSGQPAVHSAPITKAVRQPVAATPSGLAPAPPGVPAWDPALLDPQAIYPLGATAPARPPEAPAPAQQATRETQPPVVAAAAPPPPRKEKPRVEKFDGRLTPAYIASIKRRLRLTADQEEHWEPVEKMLLDLAKRQARNGGPLRLSATASQDLYWAAGPLVMSLREDQKQEARNLARDMGLEAVAQLL